MKKEKERQSMEHQQGRQSFLQKDVFYRDSCGFSEFNQHRAESD